MTAPRAPAARIALAVVCRRERVLLQRRFRRGRGFVFEFPGGHLEVGESWEAGARRELEEETGLIEPHPASTHVRASHAGGKVAFVVFASASEEPPRRVDPARRQSFHWCRHDEIPIDGLYRPDREFVVDVLARILR